MFLYKLSRLKYNNYKKLIFIISNYRDIKLFIRR